jgi:hypothetical protein
VLRIHLIKKRSFEKWPEHIQMCELTIRGGGIRMKFSNLSIGLMVFLVTVSIANALDDSLIVYYSFDYINGRTVPDISGHGLDGTIEGYPKIVEGRSGSALEFDGENDYVIAGNKDILDSIAEAVTLSAWIKTSTHAKQCIIKKNGTGGWGPGAITLEVDPHPFAKTSIWGLSPQQCVGSIVVVDNRWRHIAATWDGRTFNLYVDGFLDATCETTGEVQPSDEALCVAVADAPWLSTVYFHGVIDEVRVYNRALTKAEINELIEPIQEIRIQAHCPVDLVIRDPWGRLVNKNESTIPDSSYIETDLDGDGILDDSVVIPQGVLGNYSIEVIPELEVHPSDTYTLNVSYRGGSLCLAENVRVQDIPDDPYEFFFPQQSMESGWNLISLPLKSLDTTPDAVLSSIDGSYNSVWAYDPVEGWSIYAPGVPGNLEEMIPGRGYWVKMDKPGTLVVQGSFPEKTEIFLRGDAWNLVGYNSMDPRNTEDCMRSVESDINSVWEYSPHDVLERSWSIYIPGLPSDLGTMKSGYGYWVKAERGCIWDVNETNPPATPPLVVMPRKAYVSEDRPQVPYRLWGSIEVDGAKVVIGKDNNAPTAILKVDDRIHSSYTLGSVEGYGDYYMLDAPAVGEGILQIEMYVQVYDSLIRAANVPPGKPGEIIRLNLSIRTPPKVSMLKQNYPNPFNPDTWIPYQLKEETTVEVRIYTMTGQLVRTLNVGYRTAGFYTTKEKAVYWDGKNEANEQVASGIYFYTIQAGDFATTRKMVVSR